MAQCVGDALVWPCRLAGVFSLIKQAPPEIASLPTRLVPWRWKKSRETMFCGVRRGPVGLCLAAPAVPRWPREGENIAPVAQPSEAQHSTAQCKWQMPDAKCLSAWETKDGERLLAATAALGHGRLACNTTTPVVVRAHTSPR